MRVKVISRTIQEFMGIRYYLCGKYFQRDGVRLHRVVWEAHHGRPVPDGFDVHHDDEDRAHNEPGNLILLPHGSHTRHHHLGVSKQPTADALAAAADWHKSDEGREWHRQHAAPLHQLSDAVCEQCGKKYRTQDTGRNRFCSNACKSAWRRANGADDVERACPICGTAFRTNRFKPARTCGRTCGAALRKREARRPE
jgi:endogenous inhibitor of DNA gyrase (YacG/DUF329 family)